MNMIKLRENLIAWTIAWFVGSWFYALLVNGIRPDYTVWTAIHGQGVLLFEFLKAMVRSLGIGG